MGEPSATPITVGDFLAKLSEFYPYGEEPPRLCAALNDARTDAPEETDFDETTGLVTESKAPKPYNASTITSILEWIANRLDRPLGEAWLSQIPCMIPWAAPDQSGGEEELWAQAMAESFLGLTYSGPIQLYNMDPPIIPRNERGGLPPMARNESWEQYMFHRICRRHPVQSFHMEGETAYGARYAQKWNDPTPVPSGDYETNFWEMHDNPDPAIPIGLACQHMTTYGALTRGIPLEWLGDATNPGSGFMASDACSGMPVFGSMTSPGGKSPFGGAGHAGLVQAPPVAGKWISASPALMSIDKAIEAGLGPGTIIVHDPDTGEHPKSITFYLSRYEQQSDVYRSVYAKYFKTRAEVGGAKLDESWLKRGRQAPSAKYIKDIEGKERTNEEAIARHSKDLADKQKKVDDAKTPDQKQRATEDLKQRQMLLAEAEKRRTWLADQKTLAADSTTSEKTYSFREQLPGSHIYFVLRVHKDKNAFQAFNVSEGAARAHLTPTHSEIILGAQGDGIMDGYVEKSISPGDGRVFAGIGVLPPAPDLTAATAFLQRARPVGLARLVIAKRRYGPKDKHRGLADKNQILYVSRLLPMYGPHPSQNYTVSRLMWALRNTPGFTDLQCWWVVFAPQGLLAKCMWAEGAREMTLRKFVDTFSHSPEWDSFSFFLPEYMPFLSPKKPEGGRLEQKRKQVVRKLLYNRHYLPYIVLTNEGEKAAAGKASFVCRFKNGEGNVSGRATPTDPPQTLTSLLKTLAWDQVHLSKDLEKLRPDIEKETPAFFKGFTEDSTSPGAPAV